MNLPETPKDAIMKMEKQLKPFMNKNKSMKKMLA